MNTWIYVGKIVNTHGIKGEIKIISDFDKKEKVFKKDFYIYLGKERKREKITSYRQHKNFDMLTLEGYQNINEVLTMIGTSVFVKKEDLKLIKDEYLLEELIGLDIIENQEIVGKVIDIMYNKANILLKVQTLSGQIFYIPKIEEYIIKIDVENKKIITQNIQGLIL